MSGATCTGASYVTKIWKVRATSPVFPTAKLVVIEGLPGCATVSEPVRFQFTNQLLPEVDVREPS